MWRRVEFWPFLLTCFVAFKTLSHYRRTTMRVCDLPASTVATQQHVQNAATELLGLDRPAHITPTLQQLHLLPIKPSSSSSYTLFKHSCRRNSALAYIICNIEKQNKLLHHVLKAVDFFCDQRHVMGTVS